MKNVKAVTEKDKKYKELLAVKYVDKITILKLTKVSSTINLVSKYGWIISNITMDVTWNLRLTSIQKYWKYAGQI